MPKADREKEKNDKLGHALCKELVASGAASVAEVKGSGSDDNVDLDLLVDGNRVAVELTAYRQETPHKRVEVRLEKLTEKICKELGHDTYLRGFTLFVCVKRSQNSRGQSMFTMPDEEQLGEFAAELRRMLHAFTSLAIWGQCDSVHISFDPREVSEKLNAVQAAFHESYWSMDRAAYPTLSEFWQDVHIHRTPDHWHPVINFDLNTRFISGDETEVRRLVAKKAGKLAAYRKRGDQAPTWLVIHSDGYPMSAWIDPDDVPRMCDVARDELQQRGARFDSVYWFNPDSTAGSHRLLSIYP